MSSSKMVASLIQRFEAKNEENLTGSPTSSPNKADNTKITNTSPRSVISKLSSSVSSDSSDIDCSSVGNQLSSDLCLSREGSSLSKLGDSSSANLTLSLSLLHEKNEDMWVSPLDLDEENSELLEDKEQDLDNFDAYFPSPSFNARSKCNSFCKKELKKNSKLNFEMEEPIFWPFDYDSYKIPDLDAFLCVSPHRNIPIKSGLDPIRVRIHEKSETLKGVSGCERNIVPNPESNLTCTGTGAYSRLRKKYSIERNLTKPLKDLIVQRGLRNLKESSIEKSIGLHEFDGHEGIVELGGDNEIPLCGSPWQSTSMMKIGTQKIKRVALL